MIRDIKKLFYWIFSSIESKGNFIFRSKLMQKVNPKDTGRFKFVIHLASIKVNPQLKHIETHITYVFQGKEKTAITLQQI
jgi:hypothetical protein